MSSEEASMNVARGDAILNPEKLKYLIAAECL